jgi:hypothetical protein
MKQAGLLRPTTAAGSGAVSFWAAFHTLQRQHRPQRHFDVDRIAAARSLIEACSDVAKCDLPGSREFKCNQLHSIRCIACRTNGCPGCAGRQRQHPSDSQYRYGLPPPPSLRSLLRVRHGKTSHRLSGTKFGCAWLRASEIVANQPPPALRPSRRREARLLRHGHHGFHEVPPG